jgi:YfiH family protein
MGFVEDKRFLQYDSRCIFFDRHGGVSKKPFDSLNVSFNVGDDKLSVSKNLDIIKNSLSVDKMCLVNQVHQDKIVECSDNIQDADGIFSTQSNKFLAIRFADCMPVAIFDTKEHAACCVHAGWRGSSLEISKKAIKLLLELGSRKEDIIVTFGPHICKNCYKIKEDVAVKFDSSSVLEKHSKLYLDLDSINRKQIISCGIPDKNILSLNICTYENRNFFSYRRDGICGRNMGGVILSG